MKYFILGLFLALPMSAQLTDITSSTNVNNGHIYLMANFNYLDGIKLQYYPTYSGATTYTLGALVKSSGIVYASLQTPNLNHTPASSPTYWDPIGGGSSSSSYQKEFRVAKCQAAAGSLTMETTSAANSAPVPDCYIGTNRIYGVAKFSASNTNYLYDSFLLPASISAMSVTFEHQVNSTTTSQATVFQFQTSCTGNGETSDAAWNTAQTVTSSNLGTAYLKIVSTIGSATLTGCVANERLYFRVFRDPAHASDTNTAEAELIAVTMVVTP